MNNVDLQAAIQHSTHVEQHQQDGHRVPVDNQVHNAEVSRNEAEQKAVAPSEAEESEGKNINPDEKRQNPQDRKKKKKDRKKDDKLHGGGIIDVDA